MENNNLFSILIANYNNGNYFKDCYESIIKQTCENWECIIVDDGSTDDSVQQIKKIIGSDKRFKFFENDKNYGCGYTKRGCAELAAGEICGFLDPDDTLMANAIERMVIEHIENPDAALIYSNFSSCDESLKPYAKNESIQVENGIIDFFNFGGKISHFASFKKSFYTKTQGIDPLLQRAVDQDLYLKLYDTGKVLHIKDFLYNYRIHNGGISVGKNEEKAFMWHWMVILDTAKRRNLDLEDLFSKYYVRKNKYSEIEKELSLIKKSRFLKIGKTLGFLKNVDL